MIEEVTVGRWTPWCYYLCPVFLQGVLIMAKSSWIRSKKLALGIAVALGCSLMSVASAATYDMTSSEYTGGITLDSKTYPNRAQVGSSKVKPDVFSFRYDKNSGKIVGGDVNVTSDVMSKPVFASLEAVSYTHLTLPTNSRV